MTFPSDWTRRSFMAALPALPIVASSVRAAGPSSQLRAGAAKVDITLPLGANNGGVILRGGPALEVHDDLHARCLVLDDGRTPMAFVICDLRMIHRELVDRAKRLAAEALGWPVENILVAATHTHAAPGLVQLQSGHIDRWYAELVVVRIADAIRRAAARLAPARIGWASLEKSEHVFNRRWKVKPGAAPANPFGDKGDVVVTNPGKNQEVLEPAGPVDPELSILSVQHADGRPLAVLANYGLHYVGGYTTGSVSADYFALFSDRLGELLGGNVDDSFVGMLSNGASGDVNNVNRAAPYERPEPWRRMKIVAEDLAQAAARACREMQYHDAAPLAVAVRELELGVRRPDEPQMRWARDTVAQIRDRSKLTRPQVYAEEAIALAAGPAAVRVPLQAVRIGELCIAAAPCEIFAETGLEIKKQSRAPTFLIELANGFNGYLPTPEQHVWGGYETWPARTSYLAVDSEPQIRKALIELIKLVS